MTISKVRANAEITCSVLLYCAPFYRKLLASVIVRGANNRAIAVLSTPLLKKFVTARLALAHFFVDERLETMSNENKISNAAEKATGKIKETVGKVTNNDSLEAEGRFEQAKADVKQAGEKAKDAVKDALKDKE